jgi:hypothetical protein
MRQNTDQKLAQWIDRMMAEIRATLSRRGVSGKETDNFSVLASVILAEILSTAGRTKGRYGGHEFHLLDNAARLGLGWRTLRLYLRAMARAGIIKGVSSRAPDRQLPLEIITNPELASAAGATTAIAARALGQHFGKIWLERGCWDYDVQGFSTDKVCRWGRYHETALDQRDEAEPLPSGVEKTEQAPPDPAAAPEAKAAASECDLLKQIKLQEQKLKSVERKREAQREKIEKQKQLDDFIAGCSAMWINYAHKYGFAETAGPAWAAPKKDLPPTILRERKELEKIVACYGGEVTAWAWTVYCSGAAKRDENGKIVFDPQIAHKQWTTPDKKPSHFTKHFQLIMNEVERLGWRQDAGICERVKGYFGPGYDLVPWVEIAKHNYTPTAETAAR